ncbi:MAG: hypothetical protein ABIO96_12595 [Nitrospiraceae bacterium]
MSTKTWLLGLFAIWGMLSCVHLVMVRGESLTFVLAYEAGYTLTMLLMSYVLWLLVRWVFKFTLIVTTVLIIVVYLFGGPGQIMGNSLAAPGVAAYCQKQVEANRSLLDAAQQWNRRNALIMKIALEALKPSGGISNDEKDLLDRSAFKWTKELVENKNDRKEFCRKLSLASTMVRFADS